MLKSTSVIKYLLYYIECGNQEIDQTINCLIIFFLSIFVRLYISTKVLFRDNRKPSLLLNFFYFSGIEKDSTLPQTQHSRSVAGSFLAQDKHLWITQFRIFCKLLIDCKSKVLFGDSKITRLYVLTSFSFLEKRDRALYYPKPTMREVSLVKSPRRTSIHVIHECSSSVFCLEKYDLIVCENPK